MTDTPAALQRKIKGANELASVVRTMKALAAANIGQYESAVRSLVEYYRTVELGLLACFRQDSVFINRSPDTVRPRQQAATHAIVFGSDQGLVGQFNDILLEFVTARLAEHPTPQRVWAVGERIHVRLNDAGIATRYLPVPTSVQNITPLITRLLLEAGTAETTQLHLFHNRPVAGSGYAPVTQRLLPLDASWQREIANQSWPTRLPPQTIGATQRTLTAFVHEYLFVSLFKACAESLAAENGSRLFAMQRAEQNIGGMLEELQHSYHRQRQSAIDAELFDLLAGFESLPSSPS